MPKNKEILEKLKSPTPSKWRKCAEMRRRLRKFKTIIPYIWFAPNYIKELGYRYVVYGKHGADAAKTFTRAIRYWLWHCGVSPKIAFYTFKKEK